MPSDDARSGRLLRELLDVRIAQLERAFEATHQRRFTTEERRQLTEDLVGAVSQAIDQEFTHLRETLT